MLLIQAIRRNAGFRRTSVATIDGQSEQDWQTFVDRVARAADGLRQIGVKAGDHVGILALNSAHYLEAQFAIWWMGAVVVPMNIRWSLEENLYCVLDADIKTLVFDRAFAELAMAIAPKVEGIKLVSLDDESGNTVRSLGSLIDGGSPGEAVEIASGDLAGIYYTGGTTGFPKGVMLSHQALWSAAIGVILANGMSSESRVLHATPMFHLADGAMSHGAMIVGATHVFIPRFDAVAVLQTVQRCGVTDLLLVPTMIGMLQSSDYYSPEQMRSVRALSFGASPMPDPILARLQADLPDVRLIHVYGQTEMGPTISYLEPHFQIPGDPRAQSVGKPFACVEVKVVDDDGTVVPDGVPGEIWARGPSAMTGYWKRPDDTAAAMTNGWVRTGDIAYKDADGFLYICDRAKDMIITGGENVFSAEVENAISAHPAVAQVAVIGVPDEAYGECVHAVVVLRTDHQVTLDDLRNHCKLLIANYKCPKSLEFLNALPVSGAGKILKRDLREPHWAGRARAVH